MDFLGHLVDAPLANILIIAGLLFLGIGAVGKITGKIEPDKIGRMIASLLGLVLLAAGAVVHIKGDSSNKNQAASLVQPVVRVFSVTPSQVTKGGAVTISWDVLNADDVELEPFGQVPATGDRTVQPEQTTIYRLNATNKSGGRNGTFQEVIVKEPPTVQPARRGSSLSNPSPRDDDSNTSAGDQDTKEDQPVYAAQTPPPLPDYDQPRDPGGNSRWTPGAWYYNSVQADYYWVPGVWVTPPHAEVWTPPYWEYDNPRRYQWHHGYWGPRIGFYGGIDYGFGYSGTGYDRSSSKSSNPTSCNGGPGRVQKKPTRAEAAANRDKHFAALDAQIHLARDAKKNREQYSKANHGRPPIVVVAKQQTQRSSPQKPVKDQTQGSGPQKPVKDHTQSSGPQKPVKDQTQSPGPQKPVKQPTQHPSQPTPQKQLPTQPPAQPKTR